MQQSQPQRKTFRRYHEPGDLHELTFSCYRRMPLLTNDRWREYLATGISDALQEFQFELNAFVFMPEHVHLLIFPTQGKTTWQCISTFLAVLRHGCHRRNTLQQATARKALASQWHRMPSTQERQLPTSGIRPYHRRFVDCQHPTGYDGRGCLSHYSKLRQRHPR